MNSTGRTSELASTTCGTLQPTSQFAIPRFATGKAYEHAHGRFRTHPAGAGRKMERCDALKKTAGQGTIGTIGGIGAST